MSRGAIDIPLISKFDPSGLKQAQGGLKGLTKTLGGIAAGLAAAFSVRAVTNFAKESLAVAEAASTAQARLEAVAEATDVFGDATSEVTDRIGEFAEQQEMLIAVDANVIKGVQGQLLAFKDLSSSADEAGGTFDRVTMAAFDMASAGFGAAESNARNLGRAMEDPAKNLNILERSGVMFTEQQQDQIKAMQESGDLLGAQAMVLEAVEGRFEGVAEATADASDQLELAGKNIKQNFGDALLPVFNELVQGLLPVFEEIGEVLGETVTEMQPMLTGLVELIPDLLQSFIPLIPAVASIAEMFMKLIAAALPFITDVLDVLIPIIGELVPIIMDAISSAFEPLMDAFMILADALLPLVAEFLPMFADILAVLAPLFADVVQQLVPMVSDLLPPLLDLFMELVDALMPLVQQLLPIIVDLMTRFAPIIITVVEAFMPLVEEILPILIGLIEFLIPILEFIAELFSLIIVAALERFMENLQIVTDFIEIFSEGFMMAFEAIRDFFVEIINGLIGGFEGFINTIIGGVNRLIGALNRISVDVPATAFNDAFRIGFNIPRVSQVELGRIALADGGIVTQPINALIGEAGPEAVIPLDKMDRMGGGTVINITVNAGVGDPVRIGEEVINTIKRFERASGPVFARA